MKLDKNYQPKKYESLIYELWESKLAFQPNNSKIKYSIVAPPPNANDNLHSGHALTYGLEDIMVRFHRSLAESVLFVPGADHAGFETQVVFERYLAKSGKSRFDFSRSELVKEIYQFVDNNRQNLIDQFKKLGISTDWQRFKFSLDKEVVDLAYKTFEKMFNEGLVYRSKRLVNYCTFHETGFSDLEVVNKEETGFLYEIRYPLVDGSGDIIVATTRPETLFGDVAVAVHPKDQRYSKLIGKTLKLPLTKREIPIITDEFVDQQFGSGAVKITPAHDFNDFEVGQKHDLPLIQVINGQGLMTHDTPTDYHGKNVLDARALAIKQLQTEGYLVETQEISHVVGHCYKCDTVIEPFLMSQWYVDMKPLTQKAIKALEDNEIDFLPSEKKQLLINYWLNLKDWNISRQIAWGIPIPAFQNQDDPDDWIYDNQVDKEFIEVNNHIYVRDPDVFDTWFSSSSWPYSALNYLDGGADFKDYYPLSIMATGVDLLTIWISRMIILGIYVTSKVPFKKVYLNGLITINGQKMSKSKGNGINPLELVDKYGSDALRIGLCLDSSAGHNVAYSDEKIIFGRNFCNKLWNIARYIENLDTTPDASPSSNNINEAFDNWLIYRYNQTVKAYKEAMLSYRLAEGFDLVYKFIWNDLADWYIELNKLQPNQKLLRQVFMNVLTLVHPFAPFVSEAIYQTLNPDQDKLLISSTIQEITAKLNQKLINECQQLISVIQDIRTLLKNMDVQSVELTHQAEDLITKYSAIIIKLTPVLTILSNNQDNGVALPNVNLKAWLQIPNHKIKEYVQILDNKLSNTYLQIQNLEKRLGNEDYLTKAPKELVTDSENKLTELKDLSLYLSQEKDRYKAF